MPVRGSVDLLTALEQEAQAFGAVYDPASGLYGTERNFAVSETAVQTDTLASVENQPQVQQASIVWPWSEGWTWNPFIPDEENSLENPEVPTDQEPENTTPVNNQARDSMIIAGIALTAFVLMMYSKGKIKLPNMGG